MRFGLYAFVFVSNILFFLSAKAQSTFIPYNSDYYHLIERYEIKHGAFFDGLTGAVRPYERKAVAEFADSLLNTLESSSKNDVFNLYYLSNDSWEFSADSLHSMSKKPFLKHLYKRKSDFFSYKDEHFDLHLNPVLHVEVGRENKQSLTNYVNTRGVEIRGMIDGKIGFYTFLTENQAVFPSYVRDYIADTLKEAVPGEGFWKNYKSNGVDFFTARGYITFNITKHVHVQAGHDKHFIGNGYRSLLLSNFSDNYLFLKLNTKVWKITYTNLFAQMTADVLPANIVRPKKFLALHRLGIDATKNLNIGLFEAVAYAPRDTLNNGLELNYLNPIIFYRSVEQQLGSPDNALLGLDFRWLLWKKLSLYGQFIIDEFVIKEVTSGDGWWANKQAGQLGLKYIDVGGVRNLDLQAEFNVVRPYTFAHHNIYSNFAHYNQPLGHPLGANFYEWVGIVRYQPVPTLNITAKLIASTFGADTAGSNWGGNILLDNTTREQEYGNRIAQGVTTNQFFGDLTVTWQPKHNLFIDLKQVIRQQNSAVDALDRTMYYTSLALRLNIGKRLHEF